MFSMRCYHKNSGNLKLFRFPECFFAEIIRLRGTLSKIFQYRFPLLF